MQFFLPFDFVSVTLEHFCVSLCVFEIGLGGNKNGCLKTGSAFVCAFSSLSLCSESSLELPASTKLPIRPTPMAPGCGPSSVQCNYFLKIKHSTCLVINLCKLNK